MRPACRSSTAGLFLTDGGIETVLIFHEGLELPAFAAFDLLKDEAGTDALRRYYAPYAALAARRGLGFVAESPTWRASPRWAAELGYDAERARRVQPPRDRADGGTAGRASTALGRHQRLRGAAATTATTRCELLAPKRPRRTTRPRSRLRRHRRRHGHGDHDDLRGGGDRRDPRRRRAGLPVVISFTVETDGRLPSGQTLAEAISQVDGETGGAPAYYMINCAHPTHFEARARRTSRGASASAACAPTRRPAATRSSTRRPSSTTAIRATSPPATRR